MTTPTSIDLRIRLKHAAGSLACVGLMSLAAATAHADPVKWHLSDTTITPSKKLIGSFVYDADTDTYSEFDVRTNDDQALFVAAHQQDASSTTHLFLVTGDDDAGAKRYMKLTFAETPGNDGGAIALVTDSSSDSFIATCDDEQCLSLNSHETIHWGSITTAQTWHLEDVVTEQGQTLRGSFAYDALNDQYTSRGIRLRGGDEDVYFQQDIHHAGENATLFRAVTGGNGNYQGRRTVGLELTEAMTSEPGLITIAPRSTGAFSVVTTCANTPCNQFDTVEDGIATGFISSTRLSPELVNDTLAFVPDLQTFAVDVIARDDMDSEGNGLIFSVTGGPDAALFELDETTGVVRFLNAPFVSTPLDHDRNGEYRVEITVTDQDGRSDTRLQQIVVHGTSRISLQSSAVDFGSVQPSSPTVFADIHFASIGAGRLEISDISVGGPDAAAFRIDNGNECVGTFTTPQNCSIAVALVLDPATTQGSLNAHVKIVSNAWEQPETLVPLSAFAAVEGNIFTTSSLFVGQAPVGATVTKRTPIVVEGLTVFENIHLTDEDGPFSLTHDCPMNVVTGSNCFVYVTYAPQLAQLEQGMVVIDFADSALPAKSFEVSGEGTSAADSDNDGISDALDNCTTVANPDQIDSDGDGFGNRCDPDLNNDNVVNVVDLGMLRLVFFQNNADADFNGDGVVNVVDLGVMRSYFFQAPGPAGVVAP